MTALFRPSRAYPLPPGAEVRDSHGRLRTPHVAVTERGRVAWYPLSADGRKFLKPSAKWCADVTQADGTRKRVRFSPNRDAAAIMLAALLKKIEAQKAGTHDEYADHRGRPLSALLDEYHRHQLDRGNAARHAAQARDRCAAVFAGCGFVLLRDLAPTPAEEWLAERRGKPRKDGGLSVQTSNHYVASLKAFGNHLVKTKRLPDNPFRHMQKLNAGVDVRHKRRALTGEESARLLAAARSGEPYRGLAGPDRAMVYLTAGATGLRASELSSLVPESFALAAETPVVVVEAAYSKHRRRDEVPLHPDLVTALRPWLATKPPGEPLWAGKWASQYSAAAMIRRDLEAARQAWVAEAAAPEERAAREASDFLAYRNRAGEVADFHSTRHTFITDLVAAGVMPKDAMTLARHSTITLTMDRYAHVGIRDTAAAVSKLVLPGRRETPSDGPTARSTGAADYGDGRGQSETNENTDPREGCGVEMSKPPVSQGFECELGESRTLEAEREGFEW